jgi:hypothetical protein
MGVVGAASHAWTASGRAPFNVGDMSNNRGTKYEPHKGVGHRNGTGIDIRPVRTDDTGDRSNYKAPSYDRQATQQLVDTLRATGGVQAIYFNDPEIKGVEYLDGHDDHLHVQVNQNWRRTPGK